MNCYDICSALEWNGSVLSVVAAELFMEMNTSYEYSCAEILDVIALG